jgi:hypothetical protein
MEHFGGVVPITGWCVLSGIEPKGMIMRTSRTNGWMLAIVAAGILSAAYVASVTGGV